MPNEIGIPKYLNGDQLCIHENSKILKMLCNCCVFVFQL
jgi:hypothetical protein